MNASNNRSLSTRSGKLSFKREKAVESGKVVAGFPRELIWFYGVERLRIVQNTMYVDDDGGEDCEDWKSLPMLLWD